MHTYFYFRRHSFDNIPISHHLHPTLSSKNGHLITISSYSQANITTNQSKCIIITSKSKILLAISVLVIFVIAC